MPVLYGKGMEWRDVALGVVEGWMALVGGGSSGADGGGVVACPCPMPCHAMPCSLHLSGY